MSATTPTRIGDWMTTFTGRRFWPLDPRVEDVAIADIAHALAQQCRFAGHTKQHYSTAQHSVLVARVCAYPPCEWPGAGARCDEEPLDGYEGHRCGHGPQNALWGLLHDAAEAYCSDIVAPLKRGLTVGGYKEAEAAIQRVICEAFGLPVAEPAAVKLADRLLCKTEQRDVIVMPADHVRTGPELTKEIVPWPAERAERTFLTLFEDLSRR